jgi:DNA-binding transcriptional ArsR family regulator
MERFLSTQECAELLKAMADETRLAIVQSLFSSEKCGTELAEELALPQPHVAHHIGILKNAGLVEPERDGRRVNYKLHPVVHTPPVWRYICMAALVIAWLGAAPRLA